MKFRRSIFFKFLLLSLLPIYLSANDVELNPNDNKVEPPSFISSLTPEELNWLDKKQSLKYVYDPDWAPFEWKNDIGQHTGIISDILKLVEHKTGIHFIATNTETWEESVNLARSEKVDMFSAITINNDRKEYLHFTSNDIFSYPAALITKFNDKKIYLDINKDFKNKKIGIVKSSGLGSYIKEKNPKLNFIEVSSTKEGFSLLSSDDIDLFAINTVTARYFIEKKGFNNLKIALKLDYIYHLKIATINKLPPEIISILDKALNSITEDELNDIFNKWTEITTTKQTDWKLIIQILSICAFLFLFLLWNTRRLNLMVTRRTQELTNEQKKLLEAQRIAHIGHWEWDIVKDTLYWSDEVYRIFELKPQIFTANYESFLNYVHPIDKERVKESVKKALSNEQTYDIEHRIILPDSSEKYVRECGKVHFDEQGKPLKMLGTVHDISERKIKDDLLKKEIEEHKKNQEKLIAAKNRATQANKAKSQFLANMSHEIRTPLNGVITLSQLLSREIVDTEQHEIVDKLSLSAQLLKCLIDDILDLEKIESGKFTLECSNYNPRKVINECLLICENQIAEKKLELTSDINSSIPELLYGDSNRLTQILFNLLSNSIKFTESGIISVELTISKEIDNGPVLLLSVTDSGIGISEEDQNTIFDNFVQSDSSITRKYGGTGLGLSICRHLVNLMGGDISVRSSLGKGSSFICQFPMKPAISTEISDEPKKIITDHHKMHILVVDDDPINQFATKSLLETEGIQVTLADSGEEALELSAHENFDLILMDLHMPGLDGWETTRLIRASSSSRLAQIPIIGLTADVLKESRQLCLDVGMNSVISKPFKFTKLLQEIPAVIET